MNIYIVTHYTDNGERGEDYCKYEDRFYFSTLENASQFFWKKVTDDYEGQFTLVEWELDTQEHSEIETSVWIDCTPWWYYHYDEENYDEEDYEDSNYGCTVPSEEAIQQFLEMRREDLRHELSALLIDTNEQNPMPCDISIGEEEAQGLSSLQLLKVTSIFQQPGEGIIWFNIEGMEEPIEFDDISITDLETVLKSLLGESETESKYVDKYLTTIGSNYKEWLECEEELNARKLQASLEALNNDLDTLLK